MKNFIILFFLIILPGVSHCQSIPSIKDNLVWLEKLESISGNQEKLGFTIEKIKADSIYKNQSMSTYISESGHVYDRTGNQMTCKIVFALSRKKKTILLDLNQNPGYSTLLKYLNPETIKEIKILKDASATALFGIRGNCGVVYLVANDSFELPEVPKK
jgi:TonB-dependent SusC/RagA subfamily outer membrane receptor